MSALPILNKHYEYTEEELKFWKEEFQELKRLLNKKDLTEARKHKVTIIRGGEKKVESTMPEGFYHLISKIMSALPILNKHCEYTKEGLKKWKEKFQELKRLLDEEDLTEARKHKFTTLRGGEKKMESTMSEGFYHLISDDEPDPVLVHGYYCSDMDGEFVFGFNTYDGGGLLLLKDLKKGSKVLPVVIN